MTTVYIGITDIYAEGCNATNSFYTSGLPSLMTFVSYADMIKRYLVNDNYDIENVSICPIVYECTMNKNIVKQPHTDVGGIGVKFSPSMINFQIMDLSCHLIFKIDYNESDDIFGGDDTITEKMILDIVVEQPFLGGQVLDVQFRTAPNKRPTNAFLCNDIHNLYDKLKNKRMGYVYNAQEGINIFETYHEEFGNALDAVLFSQVVVNEDLENKESKRIRMQKSIVIPSVVGYHRISKGEFVSGHVRDSTTPIEFVEPVIGLYQLETIKSVNWQWYVDSGRNKNTMSNFIHQYFYTSSHTENYFTTTNIKR